MATYESIRTGNWIDKASRKTLIYDLYVVIEQRDRAIAKLAEAERRAERYRLAWQSAARRARGARQRGLVDAENAIRSEARTADLRSWRLALSVAARIVADLKEGR